MTALDMKLHITITTIINRNATQVYYYTTTQLPV